MNGIDSSSLLSSLSTYLYYGAVISIVLHFYLAVCLATMARKTGTSGSWMGYIPLLNLILMCRLARHSGFFVIWLFIPFVNIIVFLVLWTQIAKVRGRSQLVGLLIIIPLLGLLVPAMLAAGDANVLALPATVGAPGAAAAPAPSVCPVCGSPDCVGGAFCAYTGKPIAAAASTPAVAPPAPARAPSGSGWAKTLGTLASIVVLLAGSYFGLNRPSSVKRTQPALPARLAGSMREFPVDTASANPARPVSMVTRSLNPGKPVVLAANSFPPGIASQNLPRIASSMTSAVYKSTDQDPGVNVHVLDLRPDAEPNGATSEANVMGSQVLTASGPGAEQTGVETTSPTGVQYEGVRVRNPSTTTYIFVRPDTNTMVVLYSAAPAAQQETDRLAGNLGNGAGLMDSPDVANAISMLPAVPPDGYEMTELNAFTYTQMRSATDQVFAQIGAQSADLQNAEAQVQRFLPQQLTVARYGNGTSRLTVIVGDYGSPLAALSRWMLVRGLWQMPGLTTQRLNGTTALVSEDEENRWMILHSGQFVAVLNVPRQLPPETLNQLAGSLQIR
jgi:hypothetical protein